MITVENVAKIIVKFVHTLENYGLDDIKKRRLQQCSSQIAICCLTYFTTVTSTKNAGQLLMS